MTQKRNDLQPFNMASFKEIVTIRGKKCHWRDPYELFWEELEAILRTKPRAKKEDWKKIENDEIVLGEVWSQDIGEFYYNHTVHRFTYLYVESQGLVIDEHGHEEPANGGKQIRKVKEWYVFPDGVVYMCGKNQKHRLFNDYGKPIYVLSIKISSNGTR